MGHFPFWLVNIYDSEKVWSRSNVSAQRARHGCSREIELVTVLTLEEEKQEPFPGSDLDISSPAPQGSWMPLEIGFSAKRCHARMGTKDKRLDGGSAGRKERVWKRGLPREKPARPWRVNLFMGTPRKVKWPLPPQKQLQNSAWGHCEPEVTPAAVGHPQTGLQPWHQPGCPCAYARFPGQKLEVLGMGAPAGVGSKFVQGHLRVCWWKGVHLSPQPDS